MYCGNTASDPFGSASNYLTYHAGSVTYCLHSLDASSFLLVALGSVLQRDLGGLVTAVLIMCVIRQYRTTYQSGNNVRDGFTVRNQDDVMNHYWHLDCCIVYFCVIQDCDSCTNSANLIQIFISVLNWAKAMKFSKIVPRYARMPDHPQNFVSRTNFSE